MSKYALAAAAVVAVSMTATEAASNKMHQLYQEHQRHLVQDQKEHQLKQRQLLKDLQLRHHQEVRRPANPAPNQRTAALEEADWEFNAGLSGQFGGKPSYNVGITGRWEDEEEQRYVVLPMPSVGLPQINSQITMPNVSLLDEDSLLGGEGSTWINRPQAPGFIAWDEEQKFKLGKTLNTAVKVATTAQQLGLLEEADWGFNAGISGQVGQRPNYNVGISAKWDEEEEQKLKLGKALKKAVKVATTAQQLGLLEEADWGFNAGISGQVGGKPSYNAGISAKWDEEEEQKFKLGKALKKAAKVAVKANELGLLEEADWQFNAGLSGQVGQRPNYNVGISGKWDEEQGFGTKLNNALNTIDHAVNTAHSLGLMDEEEQKIKIGKALKKVAKVAVKANELGLLDEDEQQGLGKKINKILDKVDKVTTTAHRIQDTVNSIKSLEEDNGFLLGGEGSTWVKHQIPSDWLR